MGMIEVNGKPYIVIAGEVHNSNSSDPLYMEKVWKQAKDLGMNTLLLPATWEMIEPEEGKFNFEVIDQLIEQARVNEMHIIFLWFGSWKNAQCMYAPGWVKTDLSRFPRAEIEKGKTKVTLPEFYGMQYTTLSYMGTQTCQADAKAFAAFMAHLKKVDMEIKTVIAVQVENETGIQGAVREHSDIADQAFSEQVPEEFIVYLKKNTDQMNEKIKTIVEKCPDRGDWQTVFGGMAEEIFSTYMISGYVGKVAATGRKEYHLPLLVNCWLDREGDVDRKPGVYPVGGPVAKMMEIWKYQAKDIDIYAPDIYVTNFTDICDEYVKLDNPLFIPETAVHSHCAPRLVYCVGHYHAAGYSPFGFEDMGLPFQTVQGILFGMDTSDPMLQIPQDKEEYAWCANTLNNMMDELTEVYGTLNLQAVISEKMDMTPWNVENGMTEIPQNNPENDTMFFEKFGFKVLMNLPMISRKDGVCLILQKNETTFYIMANGCMIAPFSMDEKMPNVDILKYEEGRFKDGKWMPGRRLNGDEAASIQFDTYSLVKLELFNYV